LSLLRISPRNLFVIVCYQKDSQLMLSDKSWYHMPITKLKISL
jgi:hypothetical protein